MNYSPRGVEPEGLWLEGGEPSPGRIARPRMRDRSDIRAIERYSFEELLPALTIHECLKIAAALNPDKPAITHLLSADPDAAPLIITYRELVDKIDSAASLFQEISAGEKPVIANILPMLPEGLIASWAAATVGVGCPINPFLELDQIAAIMNGARATVLVTTTNAYGPGAWDRLDDIRARVPTLKRVLVVGADDEADDFARAVEAQGRKGASFTAVTDPMADAIHLPTGGTTGAIKIVRMNHKGQLINAWLCALLGGDTSTEGVIGHAMPNFHVGGLVDLGLRALIFGQTLLTLTTDGFRNPDVVRNFWDIARKQKMTFVLSTPTTAAAILAADGDPTGHPLQNYQCGAATIPVALNNAFREKFGIPLREVWGMTEVHGTVCGNLVGMEPMIGSPGIQLPHQPVAAFIVDDDNNFIRKCEPGERGVLVISGEGVVKGYTDEKYNGGFHVKGAPNGEIWGNSGDLGTVDSDGYVWIFGRAKDVIIRGGHNIDAKIIEEVLARHPAVQVAAAIGRPDPSKGELPVAYVQLKAGANATREELLDLCRKEVQERAAVPVDLTIIDEMPMTAVAKINKPVLRRQLTREVAGGVAREVLGAMPFDIRVDETGKRPTAVLTIGAPRDAAIEGKLAEAFRTYEFAIRIEFEG
ncbi:MAG: AMP-binding protein [Flavobacteriaceae bacterium]